MGDWTPTLDPALVTAGTVEEKYIIGEQLGKGAYSTVYNCTDKKDARVELAVKRTSKSHPEYDAVRAAADCVPTQSCVHLTVSLPRRRRRSAKKQGS